MSVQLIEIQVDTGPPKATALLLVRPLKSPEKFTNTGFAQIYHIFLKFGRFQSEIMSKSPNQALVDNLLFKLKQERGRRRRNFDYF